MKYLKRIFEGKQSDIDELKDFCEMYLAYLMDDGFRISVKKETPFIKTMSVSINTPSRETTSWNNIKDSFIPFLKMLIKDYEIGVYPNQGRPYHKSWNERTLSFSKLTSANIVGAPGKSSSSRKNHLDENIEIDKLINDDVKPLDRIYTVYIIVHTKE
jgi:hypothetical protein